MKPQDVFHCQCCGVCCRGEGGIFIRPEDATGPARLLGISAREFIDRYTKPRHGLLMILTDADGWCLLHDRENHFCRIHEAKPQMCRDWPFFFGMLNNRQGFEDAKAACPGIHPDAEWEDFILLHQTTGGEMPPRSYIQPPSHRESETDDQ